MTIIGLALGTYGGYLLAIDPLYRAGARWRLQNLRTQLDNFRTFRRNQQKDIRALSQPPYTPQEIHEELDNEERDNLPKEQEYMADIDGFMDDFEKEVHVKGERGMKLIVLAFVLQIVGVLLQAIFKEKPKPVENPIHAEQAKVPVFALPLCIGPFDPATDRGPAPEQAVQLAADKLNGDLPQRRLLSVFVLGSVDKQPLSPAAKKKFGSNRGLADARASWVEGQLRDLLRAPPDRFLVLSSGPTIEARTVKDRQQDRFVEIYPVWEQVGAHAGQSKANLPNRYAIAYGCATAP
ncbi:MAG: hypothetical protein WAK48_11125 [Candidatus Acidiferrum sp.]